MKTVENYQLKKKKKILTKNIKEVSKIITDNAMLIL
jgi:hypothetical protein